MTLAQQYASDNFEAAYTLYKMYNIHPLASLAQGAMESNYGRSGIASNARNHFGMTKGSSWSGQTYKSASSGLSFRVYTNVTESFLDFGRVLNSYYQNCVVLSDNIEMYASAISQSRYISEVNGDNRSVYRNSIITIAGDMAAVVNDRLKKKSL